MTVNVSKNHLQASKSTIFHIIHHPRRELTEEKSVTHKDEITRKARDISLKGVYMDQIKKLRVVLGIYLFKL